MIKRIVISLVKKSNWLYLFFQSDVIISVRPVGLLFDCLLHFFICFIIYNVKRNALLLNKKMNFEFFVLFSVDVLICICIIAKVNCKNFKN